ncbi:tryptophan-rich sensory protein [Demequina phytophila]|uniref:tryptophan-rich sensory protein n=1 Tax=Demequina phytophila TaxID=1638981 RepID=UPI000B01ADFD|nr:tryptophan-rich sensory protein [Demequina phytophila]
MTVTAERDISTRDVIERALVATGAVLAITGAAWGSGAFGGVPVEDAAGGVLASDATLLAPGSAAFGVWAVIYVALAVFAVVQALPGPGASPRIRAVAWPLLAAMVLNAGWIWVVQREWLAASVGVLAVILVALGVAAARLSRSRPATAVEAAAADAPVGLYLGWATVATVANVTAVGAWWVGSDPGDGTWAAVGVLVATAFVGIAMARDLSPSPVLAWTATATLAWGLAWIGEERLFGQPDDAAVGWAAIGAAAAVVLTTAITTVATQVRALRWAHRHRPRG